MSTIKSIYIYTVFVVLLFLYACEKNKVDILPIPPCEGGTTEVSYKNHIEPLIKAKCSTGLGPGTGCHDAWILTYGGAKKTASDGTLIKTTIIDKTMPKIPNNFGITDLTEEEKNLFICWVENGAPNN